MKIIVIALLLCAVCAQFGLAREEVEHDNHKDDGSESDVSSTNGKTNGWKDNSVQDNATCTKNKEIDLKQVQNRMPNAVPGQKIALTPFKNTTTATHKRMKCSCGPISEINLDHGPIPDTVTCNGYYAWVSPWNYTVVVNGKNETLQLGEFYQYYTYLNGNQYEVNFGRIVAGPCKGDVFFSTNAYVADDQLGCSGTGMKSASIDYINAQTLGNSCPNMKCSVIEGKFKYDPPITN